MMPRMSSATAVLLGLLSAGPPVCLSAQALRVPYTTFTLPNGLQVILHEDHSVPVVAVNTWYHVGSSDERPGRLGFLLPEITTDKVDLQRGVVQNERRQSYENRPYGLAEENILDRLYPPAHPYHWPVIGSMKDLQAATLEDVRRFFQSYYTPNNSTIAIAGDISPGDARTLVQRYFGDIARGPAVIRTPPPPVHLTADIDAVIEDRVQLPRVYDAWHTVKAFADDDAALDVVANVLAGGRSSRLYRRLVYDLQIATDVVAFQDG